MDTESCEVSNVHKFVDIYLSRNLRVMGILLQLKFLFATGMDIAHRSQKR